VTPGRVSTAGPRAVAAVLCWRRVSDAQRAPGQTETPDAGLRRYLESCREVVLDEIRRMLPEPSRYRSILYDRMLEYPLREAKALRPALCMATCRALGGTLDSVRRSAASLELYHNAFLIHDDIEDASLLRRGKPTLHRMYGTPIALNVGDAMLALALQPLLDNVETVGLGAALRILEVIARMARETAEGQALELDWIRNRDWSVLDQDYVEMVERKTGWYSFIAPVEIGAIAAGHDPARLPALRGFARSLAIAFQIQDDVLNLEPDVGGYGKEASGDLWEGKRTLVVLHMMRTATAGERAEAERILALPRPPGEAPGPVKTEGDIRTLLDLIDRHRSIDHARRAARAWIEEASYHFDAASAWLAPSIHRDFLATLLGYVLDRAR